MSNNEETLKFKNSIKNYLTLDQEIANLESKLKEKKNKRKNCEINVLTFMSNHKIKDLNAGNSKLKYSVTKTKKALSKDAINKTLLKYYKNEEKAIEITNLLYNNRETVEKIQLKKLKLK